MFLFNKSIIYIFQNKSNLCHFKHFRCLNFEYSNELLTEFNYCYYWHRCRLYRKEVRQIRGTSYINAISFMFRGIQIRLQLFISILSYVLLGNYISIQKVNQTATTVIGDSRKTRFGIEQGCYFFVLTYRTADVLKDA